MVTELKGILGSDTAKRLIPKFEQAIDAYWPTQIGIQRDETARRRDAREQVRMARKLEHQAQALADTLKSARIPFWACVTSPLRPRTFVELLTNPEAPSLLSIDKSKNAVDELVELARRWQTTARADARQKPGPNVGIRRHAATWVGVRLAKEGIRLTKSANGPFARVLTLIYDVASIEAPVNLEDDVKYAIDRIQQKR